MGSFGSKFVAWVKAGKAEPAIKVEVPHVQMREPTGEDHEGFREYLMQPTRPFRKPGISVTDEFNLWFADRLRRKALEAALAAAAAAAAEKPTESAAAPLPSERWNARKEPEPRGVLGLFAGQAPPPLPTAPFSSDTAGESKEPATQEYSALFAAKEAPPLAAAPFSSDPPNDRKESES
ncbi:MAG: hypothetical protein ACRD3S_11595, partial [Terracidiphilus sp.]